MIVVSGIVGTGLLTLYMKNVRDDHFKEGVMLGISWLLMNLVLDIGILLRFADMTYGQYFGEIGLRYLIIPITSSAIGYLMSRAHRQSS